jgi:hypothetical protein
MRRFKVLLGVVLFILSIFGLPADHHVPTATPPPEGVLEWEGRVAALFRIDDLQPYVELKARIEDEQHELRYKALTLGSYYRIHENLKLGAFYRLQAGKRHDDDWVFADPDWEWEDSRGRLEHVLIADVSPRFLLDFLPGKNWVLMVKNRYMFNASVTHHTILVRPGLTYFLLVDREPLFNFGFNYYLYFSLNFGDTAIYQHWPQINVLYHASPLIKLELTGSYRTTTWSTSEEALEMDGEKYTLNYRRFVVGLGLLLNIDF